MRTDRRDEAGSRASLSRRAFVLAGSGVGVSGVLGGALADPGRASGAGVVAATDPYRPSVRAAADGTAAPLRVRPARETGDAADVVVSGRPVDAAGESAVRAVADGSSVLATSAGEWREVLDRSEVRDRWTGEAPLETWVESDPSSVDVGAIDVQRPPGARVLVRGTRAYQYARGHGGVGYYGVDRDALGADDGVPVVRLGYVHANRGALADDRVASFLETYGGDGGPGRFVDPVVE